ncbi:hypothetical protein EDD16DRAFT_998864 [Pisolithus croceorrhizus]|nr:hypothetical protein EDD16DRAFT_998864 [Pisolithus croceorrhizus]
MFGSMYFAAWTAQTIKFVEVVPSAIMIYDYVLTLGEEVDCIWNKSVSVASVIYLTTRYIGTALILLSTTIFLWGRESNASGQLCAPSVHRRVSNNDLLTLEQFMPTFARLL